MTAEFSLKGKALKLDTAEDIRPHLEPLLAQADSITEISLVGNTLGIGACEELAAAVAKLSKLQKADLSDIFTGRMKEEIPKSLDAVLTACLDCKDLHTIDLSDNAFGIATIDPLEKFLSRHAPLQHLILANNGFGPQAGSRIGAALEKLASVKAKQGAPALRTIICGRNRLENGSMEAWAKMLAAHGTITELRIFQNGIRSEGISHLLLNGLNKSVEIEKLDFQDNTFTHKGASALASVVSKWPKLRELQLSDCLLSANGGIALANALIQAGANEHLEIVKLQYNEIDQRGLNSLLDAIEKSIPNLKYLELNGNCFPEDHELVDKLNAIFEKRGFGELDELDDMEEEDEDEDEDEEEEDELSDEEEKDLKYADQAEDDNVAPEQSKSVDELADKIATL